jgi:hypothetical protein
MGGKYDKEEKKGPDSDASGQSVMAGCCGHGNELSGYVHGGVIHGVTERLSVCMRGLFFLELIT